MLYQRPKNLQDALAALSAGDHCVSAGCTDLFPATERKELPGPILDISAIAELKGIDTTPDGLRIGATVTWTEIARAKLPPALRGLQDAAREVGARQIQNRATLAGNLCNASPAADGVPPLLTLDAEVELCSFEGVRRLPLTAFITGPRQTALTRGEIVTAIHIPASSLGGDGRFLKLGARKHLVISITMVAGRIRTEGGRFTEVALAVGSCSAVAQRLDALETALLGQPVGHPIDSTLITQALSPIDDMRADAGYRNHAAPTLIRRILNPAQYEEQAQ